MSDRLSLSTRVGVCLRDASLRLGVAESCTGGGLAQALTAVSGSSDYFECGLVTYSNVAKMRLLGVPEDLLTLHGAVSEPVAQAMAEGVLACSVADWAISTTGIAGPAGGTSEKPVGMVCFGFAGPDQLRVTRTDYFSGDRHEVREAAVAAALSGLLSLLTS